MKKESNQDETSYLFNVDVLVKGRSNVEALQFLLHLLSQNEQIADSRIQSGIELGNLIEAALYLKKQSAVNSPSDAAATLAEKFSKKEISRNYEQDTRYSRDQTIPRTAKACNTTRP